MPHTRARHGFIRSWCAESAEKNNHTINRNLKTGNKLKLPNYPKANKPAAKPASARKAATTAEVVHAVEEEEEEEEEEGPYAIGKEDKGRPSPLRFLGLPLLS